jgi:hypothetical protein
MQDDTSTTDTPTTAEASERDLRLMYASDRLTPPLAFAALTGQRHGLLTFDDLPWEMPDGPAFLVAVHQRLDQLGALAAHRREEAMDVAVAACPWWCWGKHATVYNKGDILIHAIPITAVELPATLNGDAACTIEVRLSATQNEDGTSTAPEVDFSGGSNLPDTMTGDGARALAAALIRAADHLDEITAATP